MQIQQRTASLISSTSSISHRRYYCKQSQIFYCTYADYVQQEWRPEL